jgi:hypothetical protein
MLWFRPPDTALKFHLIITQGEAVAHDCFLTATSEQDALETAARLTDSMCGTGSDVSAFLLDAQEVFLGAVQPRVATLEMTV